MIAKLINTRISKEFVKISIQLFERQSLNFKSHYILI